MIYEAFLICLRMRSASEQRVSLLLAECWARDTEAQRWLCQPSSKRYPRCICVCVCNCKLFSLLMILKMIFGPLETSPENLSDVHPRSLETETVDRPLSLLQQVLQMILLLAKVWEPLIYDNKYSCFQFSHVMTNF